MTRVRHRSLFGAAAIALACAVVFGCGGSPPRILFSDAQIFLYRDLHAGTTTESLRLFVAVDDGDGIEDLGLVSVVQDDTELYWQAGPEEWVTVEQDGDSWIGLPDLRPPPGENFPRGRYRVIVEDKALQEAEASFALTAPPISPDDAVFPSLVRENAGARIISNDPVLIRVFTRTGILVLSRQVSPGYLGSDFFRELPGEPGLQAYLSTPPGSAIRVMTGPFNAER